MHNGPHSSGMRGGGPDEADLLAWVEGEPLSAEANAAVAQALLSDPVLARKLESMRSDRVALQMLGEERAPRGLIASVETALQPVLERELLLGLKDGEPVDSHPVVSMVRPEKRGIFQTFLADRAGRRMALAASLLVLIGGATWYGTVMFSSGPQPVGPIAINDARNREAREAVPADSTLATKSGDSSEVARTESVVAPLTIATGPEASFDAPQALAAAPAAADASNAEATPVALADLVGPVKTPMDPALAAELARERRLVIRVVSREATTAPRRVCDRVKKEFNSAAWKLASDAPTAELATALEARPLDVGRAAPQVNQPEWPAFAGIEQIEPIVGPPAPRELAVIEEAEPQPVYVVQARLDAATMSQLRASLEKSGPADEIVFEERYEALPLASGGAPVLTPAAVLWWTNPPAGWTSWGEVPVVIEPR